MIFHMWVIKQKASNKHAKQRDSQTGNSMVVTKGKGAWRRMKRVKGG